MIGYETEEQQVQAIKQFWKDNGVAIIAGAVIGLGLLWGWRFYNDSKIDTSEQASLAYQSSLVSLVEGEDETKLQSFVTDQADTGYAPLGALILAQKAVQREDYAAAKTSLEIALKGDSSIADIARLRLANIHLQLAEHAQALKVLDEVKTPAFNAQVAELKGDALLAQGDFDAAKDAYTMAIAQVPNDPNLQMKRDNIAYAKTQKTGGNVE